VLTFISWSMLAMDGFAFMMNSRYGARSFKPTTRRQEELTVLARNCEF
jgi:hypothetical protein